MLLLLTICCGYATMSFVLLRCPGLLHGRRRRRFPPCANIAHRGGAGENYENTLVAFRRCLNTGGSQMLELDCRMTADGVVVVSHDDDLRRATGTCGRVTQTKLDELPPLQKRLPLDFVPGQSFVGDDEDRSIPTLESVFAEFPGVPINVDIKDYNEKLVKAVADLVNKFDRSDITIWGNFRGDTTDLCYQTDPSIRLYFSFPRVLKLLVLYYTGLLPFVPLRETHLEVPAPAAVMKSLGRVRFLLDAILMRRRLFEHLKSRGIPVFVWVLNTEEEFERAFASGASGVMTDYPSKLDRYLREHPHYPL